MENENKNEQMFKLLEDIQTMVGRLRRLLEEYVPVDEHARAHAMAEEMGSIGGSHDGTIIEGVFNGQNMVAPDGKIYTVPANYASKSKLVEGDILKLTIKDDGSFLYKQIGPVKRRRLVGKLVRDDTHHAWRALTSNGHSYRLLLASVTYFHAEEGDDVVMLMPSKMQSRWAAVENIVKNMSDEERDALNEEEYLLENGADAELESGTMHTPTTNTAADKDTSGAPTQDTEVPLDSSETGSISL